VSSYLRSRLPGAALGVISSNQHVVKPWLTERLYAAPVVKDLKDEGFPLEGARLDYVGGRTVGSLVYRHDQHVIDVLVWPTPDVADQAPQAMTRQGYHLIRWADRGVTYWAVSDLNEAELHGFVDLIRR
jgi:anti-sigma factor RsiW